MALDDLDPRGHRLSREGTHSGTDFVQKGLSQNGMNSALGPGHTPCSSRVTQFLGVVPPLLAVAALNSSLSLSVLRIRSPACLPEADSRDVLLSGTPAAPTESSTLCDHLG